MYQKVSTAIFVILVAHMELPERLFPALHVDSYSIRDFLNTKEYIWTYNTTKTNVIRCRYDLMLFVEGRFICFNRTMLNGRQRISVQLLGQFSRRRLGRMYVFREDVISHNLQNARVMKYTEAGTTTTTKRRQKRPSTHTQ
uniref:Lipocalin n=1 Tax=Rhipicephalus zambeziensis TaxID=60191 RepID=A0A224YBZ0_9ACAR